MSHFFVSLSTYYKYFVPSKLYRIPMNVMNILNFSLFKYLLCHPILFYSFIYFFARIFEATWHNLILIFLPLKIILRTYLIV